MVFQHFPTYLSIEDLNKCRVILRQMGYIKSELSSNGTFENWYYDGLHVIQIVSKPEGYTINLCPLFINREHNLEIVMFFIENKNGVGIQGWNYYNDYAENIEDFRKKVNNQVYLIKKSKMYEKIKRMKNDFNENSLD